LIEALQEYELALFRIRSLRSGPLLFHRGHPVNRFVMENRRQVERLETLSKQLEETNGNCAARKPKRAAPSAWPGLGHSSPPGLAHEIRNPLE